ncbi:MAG: hypothetical protein QY321_03310 [Patescibacteria group bacterium]|nr:MAG: hypothetical protein QY321_03310 [Patescibacteria group bacterium]
MIKRPIKSRISAGDRMSDLAKTGEVVFSLQDLSTIWNISDRQSLRIMVARYVQRGFLYRIFKGLYSLKKPQNLHPWLLGLKALSTYGYVSCETVLFEEGIINQRPFEVTLVSNSSKRFSVLNTTYRVRQMKDELLYDDSGIIIKNGVRTATVERAKQDMNYFNSKKYYDADF